VTAHADRAELVAFADVNSSRIRSHNRWLEEMGHPAVAAYRAEAVAESTERAADWFTAMLDKERVDAVIVTSMDSTHEQYIVAALQAGRSVITEKPMTTTAQSCTRILVAAREARAKAREQGRPEPTVAVAFNYRYNPTHVKVRELLAGGEIGEIGSVHFEWLLDVRHGADYFRRWHRHQTNSGGLLVHKSSHHFDLVNWWLGSRPQQVFAQNRLFFYGPEAGGRHGYDRGYERAHGAPQAQGDPFALNLDRQPRMRELYFDAEVEDGYIRDRNVFAPGVTIADDMSVLVRYESGATMTYHLNAYAPWEGYRLMVNGSKGRLELEVVETAYVNPPAPAGSAAEPRSGEGRAASSAAAHGGSAVELRSGEGRAASSAAAHGGSAAQAGTIASLYPGHSGVENGWTKLTLHPYWQPARTVEIPEASQQAHGGGDARLTADLFAGSALHVDPLGRRATEVDGALALLTGLAGNASAETGRAYDVAELIDPELLKESARD
jgi:predicted dehydrogenase